VIVVCFQVEISATGRSLAQRNPTVCGESVSVIWEPRQGGGRGPLGLSIDEKEIIIISAVSGSDWQGYCHHVRTTEGAAYEKDGVISDVRSRL
jgi:hypothetical protein